MLAQVEQSTSVNNGVENGGSNGTHHVEQMDISTMSNGTTTPTKDLKAVLDSDALQLSPNERRRSTRACAIKAQEKIKLKDDIVVPEHQLKQEEPEEDDEEDDQAGPEGASPKKRKLENGAALNQFSFRFGVRIDDGDVYAMTDESELSSLHESELDGIRVNYEKMLSRELSEEQKNERLKMIKQAEADLRLEEARLTMLRKMKSSQAAAAQKAAEARRFANIPSNSLGASYKPLVAPPLNKTASNGASSSRANQLNTLGTLTPQQQQEMLSKLAANPQLTAQALQATKSGNLQEQANIIAKLLALTQKGKEKERPTPTQTPAPSASSTTLNAKVLAAQTPKQRAAAARAAFRTQADKQLMQLTNPKSSPHELFFIPNPNQSDFAALLGLDLVVQRVLRDDTLNKPVSEPCYECEECHTDFTPTWRGIGGDPANLHLYCEGCVRGAQKKKVRQEHTSLLKRAFAKISNQEKEFEKQISDGKLDAALAAAAAAEQARNASVPSTSSTVSSRVAAASSSGTSTPASVREKTSHTSKASTSSAAATAAASAAAAAAATKKFNASNAQMQQMMMQQVFQNPMAASMFRNMGPMMQMWNPATMAAAMSQSARGSSNGAAAASVSTPNMATMMSMIAQASQQNAQAGSTAHQQQQRNQLAAFMAMVGSNQAAANQMNSQMMQSLQQMTPMQQRTLLESFKAIKK